MTLLFNLFEHEKIISDVGGVKWCNLVKLYGVRYLGSFNTLPAGHCPGKNEIGQGNTQKDSQCRQMGGHGPGVSGVVSNRFHDNLPVPPEYWRVSSYEWGRFLLRNRIVCGVIYNGFMSNHSEKPFGL